MSDVRRSLLICYDRSGCNLLRSMVGRYREVHVIPPLPIIGLKFGTYYDMIDDLMSEASFDSSIFKHRHPRDVARPPGKPGAMSAHRAPSSTAGRLGE